MNRLYLLVTISDRNQGVRFLAFYREYGVTVTFTVLGRGTASSEILDTFGLEASDKSMTFAAVTDDDWDRIKKGLEKEIKIDIPGTGVAFIIPLCSVGGRAALRFLTAGRDFEPGEESTLKETDHELIVVTANQGYTDMVMDAARAGGASGGTVIHAKGTGMNGSQKFLGVSLATEREVIFIVAKSENAESIMNAVMRDAGTKSKAGSIVFSLPVTDTAGMRLTEE